MRCEAFLCFTKGIRPISETIIEKERCIFPANYKCVSCGKMLCLHHATADTNSGSIYCKECHPNKEMVNCGENILIA
jgi:hypothetical protein